jgi:tRNA threonylcarbamoyl adenosine modification protein (Sua5/YciO/YrdC/YwlC family)
MEVVEVLRGTGVIIYPTDSCYALGCCMGDKAAQERIRAIRQVGPDHNFTLVCRNLSELASFGRIDNQAYRLVRSLTPGPYTFILRATRGTPRRLQNPRRKTIGLRVPDHPIVLALLEELDEPIMSSTLLDPVHHEPVSDPVDIEKGYAHAVDLVVDGGYGGLEPTTVIDLSVDRPVLLRRGKGDTTRIPGLVDA